MHTGVNCVCVASPTLVGARSMALLLGQPFEYYCRSVRRTVEPLIKDTLKTPLYKGHFPMHQPI